VKIYRKISPDKNIQFFPADIRLITVYKSDSFEQTFYAAAREVKKQDLSLFSNYLNTKDYYKWTEYRQKKKIL